MQAALTRAELTQKVKEIIQSNGFGLVGIAPVTPQPQDIEFWKLWIVDHHHGEMAYLENPHRSSIANWYPQAKSVIIAALFYRGPFLPRSQKNMLLDQQDPYSKVSKNQQDAAFEDSKKQGRIASYAVYKDYHRVIQKRLKKAIKEVQELAPETQAKIFVDSSPVLERAYAKLTGLGWIGKNTMMINPRLGSYFFLAGMATNLDLEKDRESSTGHCGSCTRCIDACPTQCLTPYKMDATRCISYLTIEKKTIESDPELSKKTTDWIFGCDICQEVCPFNRVQKNQEKWDGDQDEEWKPLLQNTISLETVLNWTQKEYKEYFAGTPVLRAKWRVFLKNTIIAAANSGNLALKKDLERIQKTAEDEDIKKVAEAGLIRLF